MEKQNNTVTINGVEVKIGNERNLLELIRKAGVELPTFCYHSELSIYGACRLCLVDIEGKGIMGACSILPSPGMKIKTHTKELRDIRKIAMELFLANHDQKCASCARGSDCKLRELAMQLGVDDVRYKHLLKNKPLDNSSLCIVRNPNRCVLCGDCVRYCLEIQSIGAIDFAFRGANTVVAADFNEGVSKGPCVGCGQCARVCPTGAITPKFEIDDVFKAISDKNKIVVAQVAPAVRVAFPEMFPEALESKETRKSDDEMQYIAAALKLLGFDYVFDTSFAADLTILEEAHEFIERKKANKNLPIFTSCCPAWVKFAEEYLPGILPHLSSARSPQAMFGSLAKVQLAKELKIDPKDLIVVSIMPCTAKKYEARQEKFSKNGIPDVDFVLTTKELGVMASEMGILYDKITPVPLDTPFGDYTGGAVIFGNTGGVSEAAMRHASFLLTGKHPKKEDFTSIRGEGSRRISELKIGDVNLKLAVVHGLKNAREIAKEVLEGKGEYDIIEVMSCPMGCVGGAGQPVPKHYDSLEKRRTRLYGWDDKNKLTSSEENKGTQASYENYIAGGPDGQKAHELFHTHYSSQENLVTKNLSILKSNNPECSITLAVAKDASSQDRKNIMQETLKYLNEKGKTDKVDLIARFCNKLPDGTIGVDINGKILGASLTFSEIKKELDAILK